MSFSYEFKEIKGKEFSAKIAPVPWDSDTFKRPVFELQFFTPVQGYTTAGVQELSAMIDNLGAFLCTARISSDDATASIALQEAGFVFIQNGYDYYSSSIQSMEYVRSAAIDLEPVMPHEEQSLFSIANGIFTADRFYSDPRIPRPLVEERFRRWIESSLHASEDTCLLLKDGGVAIGFAIYRKESLKHYRILLIGLGVQYQGKGNGNMLWCSTLGALKEAGAESISVQVSSRNIKTMNLWTKFHFSIKSAESILHYVR